VVVQHLTGSCLTCSCIVLFPVISLILLMVGISGILFEPRLIDEFSWFLTLGVPGTLFSIFYAFIIAIGACVERAPLLPITRGNGSSGAKYTSVCSI